MRILAEPAVTGTCVATVFTDDGRHHVAYIDATSWQTMWESIDELCRNYPDIDYLRLGMAVIHRWLASGFDASDEQLNSFAEVADTVCAQTAGEAWKTAAERQAIWLKAFRAEARAAGFHPGDAFDEWQYRRQ